MNANPFSYSPRSHTIKVAAIYDGLMSFVYAHEAFGSLGLAAAPHARIESNVWSFDNLIRLDLRHASLRIAAEAELILVAAGPESALPRHVQDWLKEVLREDREHTPVIVALHERMANVAGQLPLFLRQLKVLAAGWRAPVLTSGEFDGWLRNEFAAGCAGEAESGADEKVTSPPSLLADRWGINE